MLLDFANWLRGRPWGSVGCFSLVGQFADAAPIVDGSPLRDRFALFMRLPDGSAVGGWYGAGLDRDDPPIVGLGSEGDYQLLAPSLDALLSKLTSHSTRPGTICGRTRRSSLRPPSWRNGSPGGRRARLSRPRTVRRTCRTFEDSSRNGAGTARIIGPITG